MYQTHEEEIARLYLKEVKDNQDPTTAEINEAIREVGDALSVMTRLVLPLMLSLGPSEPKPAHALGVALLLASLTDEMERYRDAPKGFLQRVVAVATKMEAEVASDIETERRLNNTEKNKELS